MFLPKKRLGQRISSGADTQSNRTAPFQSVILLHFWDCAFYYAAASLVAGLSPSEQKMMKSAPYLQYPLCFCTG